MADAQTKSAVECRMNSPQFVIPDVVAAAEYYRDVLGFRILGYSLDSPVHAIVARDCVEIHFGKTDTGTAASPNIRRCAESRDAYIWVNDLDPLHAELRARGAKIVEPPATRVYKCYEMVVEDDLGFRLAFAIDLRCQPGAPAQS
jgi:catechol 2,3-dioxygenase-like lactoylglutathione lyase family enzyme